MEAPATAYISSSSSHDHPQHHHQHHRQQQLPPHDVHSRPVLANVNPNLPAILPPPVYDPKCSSTYVDRGQRPVVHAPRPAPPTPHHAAYNTVTQQLPQYGTPQVHHQPGPPHHHHQISYAFPPIGHQTTAYRQQLPSIQHTLPESPRYNTPATDLRGDGHSLPGVDTFAEESRANSAAPTATYHHTAPSDASAARNNVAIYSPEIRPFSAGMLRFEDRTSLPASPIANAGHFPFYHHTSAPVRTTPTPDYDASCAVNTSAPTTSRDLSMPSSRPPMRPQIITSLIPRSYDPSPIARSASVSRLDIRSLTTPTTPSTPDVDYYSFPTVPTIASSDALLKRKALQPQETIFIDDPRCQDVNISCDAVRTKIRRLLESGAMDVPTFQRHISANPKSYAAFMAQKGPYKGVNSSIYTNAFAFFKHRELNGAAPLKRRRVDKSEEEKLHDVSGVSLPGEKDGLVEVYDTCDEVRKKIRAYLGQACITQAGFLREVAKAFPGERKLQSKLLNDFLSKKGASAGNTSSIYYGAYVFFEKVRIRDGRDKTETRREMERLYDGSDGEPRGMDVRTKMRGSAGSKLASKAVVAKGEGDVEAHVGLDGQAGGVEDGAAEKA